MELKSFEVKNISIIISFTEKRSVSVLHKLKMIRNNFNFQLSNHSVYYYYYHIHC